MGATVSTVEAPRPLQVVVGLWGSMAAKVTFGSFTLDADRRLLFEGEREVHLTPKAFELLRLLVNERPRALSKTEIHESLWPGTFVSDGTLARVVADLRAAMGGTGHDEGPVRTIHGFGYAFDADARVEPTVDESGAGPQVSWTWFETHDGRRFPLHEDTNALGRSATAEVCLDDSTVSRHHACISVTATGATIEDLGSRNGTLVNGASVTSPTPLRDGDEVKAGSVALRFRTLLEPGSTTVPPKAPE